MAPVAPRSLLAKSFWQKEMQRTVAIAALETLYAGPTMKRIRLHNEMHVLFHGNAARQGSLGYTDHLLQGIGKFAPLWDKEPLANDATGSGDNLQDFDLVLKQEFSRDACSYRYVVGSQFTKSSLGSAVVSRYQQINGRTLLATAQRVLRNWKKALAYGKTFLLPDGTLPSGTTEDAYFRHVLTNMYVMEKKETAALIDSMEEDIDDDEDDDPQALLPSGAPQATATAPTATATAPTAATATIPTAATATVPPSEPVEEMVPKSYLFQGFVSFRLFGHFAEESNKSQLLLLGDCHFEPGKKTAYGRAASRAAAAAAAAAERNTWPERVEKRQKTVEQDKAKEAAENVTTARMGNKMMCLGKSGDLSCRLIDYLYKSQERHADGSVEHKAIQVCLDNALNRLENSAVDLGDMHARKRKQDEAKLDSRHSETSTPANRSWAGSPIKLISTRQDIFSPVAVRLAD